MSFILGSNLSAPSYNWVTKEWEMFLPWQRAGPAERPLDAWGVGSQASPKIEAGLDLGKERHLRKEAARSARAALNKMARLHPRSEWCAAPKNVLGFRPVEKPELLQDPLKPRVVTLLERVIKAEEQKWATMHIGGMVLPAINGYFFPYLMHDRETPSAWRNRLMKMRSNMRYAQKLLKERSILDLPLWEQIRRLSQMTGTDHNMYRKLPRDNTVVEELETQGCSLKPRLRQRRVLAGCSPKPSDWDSMERIHAHKRKLYELQQEWREARFLRREKMSRALVVIGSHLVRSLRSQLEVLAEPIAKTNFQQELKGEGCCFSKCKEDPQIEEAIDYTEYWSEDDNVCIDPAWEALMAEVEEEEHQLASVQEELTVSVEDYRTSSNSPFSFQNYPPLEPVRDIRRYLGLHPDVKGEMDVGDDAHGDDNVKIEQTSTVVIEQPVGTEVASSLPETSPASIFQSLSAKHSEISDTTFHDRWYTIHKSEWKGSQARGFKLFSLDLPRDVLENEKFKESPNYIIFSRHMYWKGDIEVKILANTNIRQMGQLQFNFYYSSDQDKYFSEIRDNIWSASQRLHTLLTANTNNEVIIKIPFEYVHPILTINRMPKISKERRNLGKLTCFVLVPLSAPLKCTDAADVSVLVRFLRNEFHGMVGSAMIEGQMFSAFASVIAARALLDKNRDRPTVTAPGMSVIPVNSSSWCIGTNQPDFSNILRLNPNCMLPYPEGRIPAVDEMSIEHVVRTYGLIDFVEWTDQMKSGHFLKSINATSLDDVTNYVAVSTVGGGSAHQLPPVATLSSAFAYWRGSLELRIDVVSATEISGRLLIAYVPRVYKDQVPAMEDLYACAHTLVDIKENRQIIFKIPYVANHMFYPRRTALSTEYPVFNPPGAVFLYVFNQMRVNCSIPPKAVLVMYLRAGDDFELGVPACPSVGLSFNPEIYHPKSIAHKWVIKDGYYPIYVETWHNAIALSTEEQTVELISKMPEFAPFKEEWLSAIKSAMVAQVYVPIFRYGAVSDHVSQMQPIGLDGRYMEQYSNWIVEIEQHLKVFPCKLTIKGSNLSKTIELTTTHFLVSNKYGEYYVFFPLDEQQANLFKGKTTAMTWWWNIHPANLWIFSIVVTHDIKFDIKSIEIPASRWWEPDQILCAPFEPMYVQVEADAGEQDKNKVPAVAPQDSAKKNAALTVWGEQFLDLKDYCRRYQLYATGAHEIEEILDTDRWRTISLKFPVMPQGLDLDLGNPDKPNEYWNRTREGPIPLIASAYRFFTGGIRFRICINLTRKEGLNKISDVKGKIFVQHRPNVISSSRTVTFQSNTNLGSDDLELPGYAAYHQFEDINNVLSVEIPFYLPSVRGYLQRPADLPQSRKFSTLGEVAVGITVFNYKSMKLTYDIYYSLADDARFSVFVGFPSVIDISSIPPINPPDVSVDVLSNEIPMLSESVKEKTLEKIAMGGDSEAFECFYTKAELKQTSFSVKVAMGKVLRDWHLGLISDDEARHRIENLDDFVKLDTLNSRCSSFSNISKPEVEGQMFNIFSATSKVEEAATEVKDVILENRADLKDTMSSVQSAAARVKEFFSDHVPTFEDIQFKFQKYLSLIINAITNLVHCLINLNVKSLLVAIVSFFTQLKLISFSAVGSVSTALSNLMNVVTSSSTQQNSDVDVSTLLDSPVAEAPGDATESDSIICSYVSSLIAGVASLFNFTVKFSRDRYTDLSQLILDSVSKFAFTANHLFTFVKNNLIAIKRIGEWMFGDHPSIRTLGVLKNKDESLYKWAEEVLEITDPRKENKVFTSARIATKVYSLAAQASVLQIRILKLDFDRPQVAAIQVLIKKIHDLRDRLAKTHTAPPVRFEPFMIDFAGPTGVGKSHIFKSLPYALFKELGLTHEGELLYHRALGNQYWNNLRNQPVLIIDEKFPIKDPEFLNVQLSELFQLKSSCVFNPPMADIPDKNIRYNPILVLSGCNNPFPEMSTIAFDQEAVFRRRDMLIHVNLRCDLQNKGYKEYKDIPLGERGNPDTFDHLEFQIYRDVKAHESMISNNRKTINNKTIFNYTEIFQIIADEFRRFYVLEEGKYRKELARMMEILPADIDSQSSISKIFDFDWIAQQCAASSQEREATSKQRYDYVNSLNLPHKLFVQGMEAVAAHSYESKDAEKLWADFCKELAPKAEALVKLKSCVELSDGSVCTVDGCIHSFLNEIYYYRSTKIIYNLDNNSFITEIDEDLIQDFAKFIRCSPDSMTEEDFFKLPECFFVSVEGERYFSIPYSCTESGLGKLGKDDASLSKFLKCKGSVECWAKEFERRYRWLKDIYLAKKPEIVTSIGLNQNVLKDLPAEYFEHSPIKKLVKQIKEHEESTSKLESLRKFFNSIVDKFYKIEWRKWLKKIGFAIAIISFIGVLMGLWNWSKGDGLSTDTLALAQVGGAAALGASRAEPNAHVSGDYKLSKSTFKLSNAASKSINMARGEMGVRNSSSISAKFRRNVFYLDMLDGPKSIPAKCLGICGRYALIVDHYWDAWSKCEQQTGNGELRFLTCWDKRLSGEIIDKSEIKIFPIDNSALLLIELPKRIPLFRDIRSLIAPLSAHKNLNLQGSMFELVMRDENTLEAEWTHVRFFELHNLEVKGNRLWGNFEIHHGYEYDDFCGNGKCGSLLLAHNLEAPIIGMHVAGYVGIRRGVSDLIYREMFDHLPACPERLDIKGEGDTSKFFVDAKVLGLGKVSDKFAHQERGKSRIVPSVIQTIDQGQNFKIYSEPAVLSSKDPRIKDMEFSPMIEGVKFHGQPLKPFDPKLIDLAKEDLKNLILAKCLPVRKPALLTLDESVGGIPGLPGFEHMEFSTSEGFPFVGLRPAKESNKRWLFEFNDDNLYVGTKDILKNYLAIKWDQRLQNIIPNTVFTDCLKDCTVTKEKVLQRGKTRIFSMAPVDFTIHQRMCTLDFVVSYMKHRLDLEHMIGCNPNSIEWTWLCTNLLKKGDAIMTGDYSKYGDTIPFEFVEAAFEIIAEWYKFNGCNNIQQQQQLKIFPFEIGHSIHLMFDHLYQCMCGQPSGNSLTVIINSIANSLYMRVAWLEIMKFTAYNSLADFHKLVTVYSYGDDLIVSLSTEIKDIFNAVSIGSLFKDHGLKFTNANKSDELVPYGSIDEADFLKSGFRPHPSRTFPLIILAPLGDESIEDTVNWVWGDSFGRSEPGSMTFTQMSVQVCEDSIRNAFGRGPAYYNKWVSKLKEFWLNRGVCLRVDTWEQMDYKIFGLNLTITPYYKKINKLTMINEAPV